MPVSRKLDIKQIYELPHLPPPFDRMEIREFPPPLYPRKPVDFVVESSAGQRCLHCGESRLTDCIYRFITFLCGWSSTVEYDPRETAPDDIRPYRRVTLCEGDKYARQIEKSIPFPNPKEKTNAQTQ